MDAPGKSYTKALKCSGFQQTNYFGPLVPIVFACIIYENTYFIYLLLSVFLKRSDLFCFISTQGLRDSPFLTQAYYDHVGKYIKFFSYDLNVVCFLY